MWFKFLPYIDHKLVLILDVQNVAIYRYLLQNILAAQQIVGRRNKAMVRTMKAHTDEMGRIAAFYRANEYRPTIRPTDVIVIAKNDGKFCGAVRLCEENSRLVLRGMRVSARMRRQGIGTQLLETAELFIGDREYFCISHHYLQSLYGRKGFVVIDESEAPSFLRAEDGTISAAVLARPT